MVKFLVGRIATGVLVLFAVTALTFLLVGLIPGNAARTILGISATPTAIARLSRELHLNAPITDQYWSWLKGLFHGNLGTSLVNGQSVGSQIVGRLQPTISLILLSSALSILVATTLGVYSAVRGGVVARLVDSFGLLGFAIPGFIIALLLIYAFAVKVKVFPVVGYNSLSSGLGNWAKALVLPVVAMSLNSIGFIAKQVRQSTSDVLDSEFVVTLTANGFKRRSILYRHVLRNAIVPSLAMMGVQMAGAIATTVLIETVFGIPGIGSLAVSAAGQQDLPMVQATALFFTAFVVIINFSLDIVFVMLDPRVRIG
jgi:peptide/nickel transport system permease protein